MTKGPYGGKQIAPDQIPVDLLFERIELAVPEKCWMWMGTRSNGRPVIQVDGQRWNAKRLMWMYWNEENVPDGKVISQSCGNGLCMNRNHLVAITQAEAVSRGMARQHRRRAS